MQIEALAYTLLRIAFGLILLTHGLPKLLGQSHGPMGDPMQGSIHLIGQVMGLPLATQLAWLIMLLETGGALLLVLGAATRLVSALVLLEMLGICVALGPVWPWIDRGIEYPVLMAILMLYVFARGGGRYALDHWIATKRAPRRLPNE